MFIFNELHSVSNILNSFYVLTRAYLLIIDCKFVVLQVSIVRPHPPSEIDFDDTLEDEVSAS